VINGPEDHHVSQSSPSRRKVRYAVIGLGHIAQAAVLPAFAHAKSKLRTRRFDFFRSEQALRTGAEVTKVSAMYDYAGLRLCLAEESIDALYMPPPIPNTPPSHLSPARRACMSCVKHPWVPPSVKLSPSSKRVERAPVLS